MDNEDVAVIDQNNLGVVHLMNGNLNGAYRCLNSAFEMAKARTAVRTYPVWQGSNRRRLRPLYSCFYSTRTDSIDFLNSALVIAGDADILMQGRLILTNYVTAPRFVVFENYDNFTTNEISSSSRVADVNWILVTAFICFNLGLVYNAAATSTNCSNIHSILRKSVKMLNSCRRLLLSLHSRTPGTLPAVTDSPFLCASGNPLVDLLCISTITTLAETYYRLSDLDMARSYSITQINSFLSSLQYNQVYMEDGEMRRLLEANLSRRVALLPSCLRQSHGDANADTRSSPDFAAAA